MPLAGPFEEHAGRYDRWFETHEHAYRSEVAALGRLVPERGDGIEVGVGTGRFAAPLGIRTGLDPAEPMLRRAADRGIEVVRGVAEALPFGAATFDTVLMVTTVCFVDDLDRTLREARRVLRPGGRLVVGYVDRDSPLGRRYRRRKDENPFYRDATFVPTDELVGAAEAAGFRAFEFVQTLFRMPDELTEPDRVAEGHDDGSFVGLAARP